MRVSIHCDYRDCDQSFKIKISGQVLFKKLRFLSQQINLPKGWRTIDYIYTFEIFCPKHAEQRKKEKAAGRPKEAMK